MCGITALYILDKKGRVLICRHFRSDVPPSIYDTFNKKLLEFDEFTIKPIIKDKDNNIFYFHKHQDLTFVAISKKNNNALMIFTFLHSLVEVLKTYFKNLEEESVRDNFIVIYELLDEMMDNGYPQTTETKLLKQCIKSQVHELKILHNSPNIPSMEDAKKFGRQFTNATYHRSEGIKYSKNQFYLDVIEKLSMLIGPSNNVIKSQVVGQVQADCKLSGMPQLKLGLNDKTYYELQGRTSKNKSIQFDDIKFHHCVRLGAFQNERLITFIPPDGQFQLMSYRISPKIKPLFLVDSIVEEPSENKIRFLVKVKSNYKEKSIANNVEVLIPVPDDVQCPKIKTIVGNAVYYPEKNSIKWNIKQFAGHKQFMLNAEFKLPLIASPKRNNFRKEPIGLKFEIASFTVSGFQVRYLKVIDSSGYKSSPWVKYLTVNGEYQIRTQ